jgi:hypothetical protein
MGFLNAFSSPEKLAKKLKKEFRGVNELEETVNDLIEISSSEMYWEYFQVVKLEEKIWETGWDLTESEKKNIPLINLAYETLSNPPLNIYPITDLIEFLSFYVMYRIFEDIYYLYKGSKMNHADSLKIFYGKLDERVIFGMDQFDTIRELPEPTPEYFQQLKKIDWKDKETKKLYKGLNEIMSDNFIEKRRTPQAKFAATEETFILFLSACNAVNNNRIKIEQTDVIIAYKTYFKLLKTDITKLM